MMNGRGKIEEGLLIVLCNSFWALPVLISSHSLRDIWRYFSAFITSCWIDAWTITITNGIASDDIAFDRLSFAIEDMVLHSIPKKKRLTDNQYQNAK